MVRVRAFTSPLRSVDRAARYGVSGLLPTSVDNNSTIVAFTVRCAQAVGVLPRKETSPAKLVVLISRAARLTAGGRLRLAKA